ncbi:restriction endonuclease subunit S [Anaeromassilibacillus senegalensis]|uniref:Restriction endonuclease subunit S n=1 Tax=Anaeromassilibacillus senegalensis TaxID=1673717 RepID=A0ABS9CPI4_9FIRM|nr:restriction endonuclease subunit S [Anaeromassilibacillus senegalensis]MCF2652848.1 restriction endonuclease subunit S [Anaeromassilibacillus senegalensis]
MNLIEFGSIAHIKKGKKPLRQINHPQAGYLPYVDIEAFETGNVKAYADGEKCLPCQEGEILIVCDGSRSGFVGRAIDGYVGSTLAVISADGMSSDYLYYFLKGKYELLNTKKKGTGTPHLDQQILFQQKLIVPSLEGQEKIVAWIEELFSELDNGVETLRKTKQQLAVYRQAVYASVYGIDDLRPITDFFDISGGLTKNSKRHELPIKMPYLRVANVYYNELDLSEIKYIGVTENEVERTLLRNDDLLFVEGNGSKEQIGRVAIWDGSVENCLHQNHLIKGRPVSGMLSQYALYYLISRYGRKQILDVASSTSGLYTLSTNKVRNLKIPYVDIEQQKTCIETIEARISVCDSIEKTVDTALQQVEAMRQSILKQAFEGKL